MSPASLATSMAIGTIGLALFVYGKRRSRTPQFWAGILLMVFPYFVPSVPAMLGIAGGILGLLWLGLRYGL